MNHFDIHHWNRVKQARAELGLNKIPAEATLRPSHRLAHASVFHRETKTTWAVSEVREEWLLGRYLTATLVREDGTRRTVVVEAITTEEQEIIQKLAEFNTEFEVLLH
jgi:hypothetical protein